MLSDFEKRAKHLAISKVFLIATYLLYQAITPSTSEDFTPIIQVASIFLTALILLGITLTSSRFRQHSNWVVVFFDYPTLLWNQSYIVNHSSTPEDASFVGILICIIVSSMSIYLHTRLSLIVGFITASLVAITIAYQGSLSLWILPIIPIVMFTAFKMFHLLFTKLPTETAEANVSSQLDTRALLLLGAEDLDSDDSMPSWQAPATDKIDQLCEHYEILNLIGRGSMGAVYRAKCQKSSKLVALKILPEEITLRSSSAVKRFQQEAEAMSSLSHPNIASILDYKIATEELCYIAMEYVPGDTLQAKIRQGLTIPESLKIISDLCMAIGYAHEQSVIHRDIKPSNIIIGETGAKLVDFGLAKSNQLSTPNNFSHLTKTGVTLGTPFYMAPEQVNSNNYDHRVDLYAIGVVFYEMLTSQLPQGIFPPPSEVSECSEELDSIIIKLMQSSPEKRYQSALELLLDIREIRSI